MSESGTRPTTRRRHLAVARRVVGVLAVTSALVSITIQLRTPSQPATYLPAIEVDTSTGIEVLARAEVGPLLLLEHRAPPDHRILRYDPASGELTTVLELGEDDVVNGLAMAPDGSRVAVAHAPDRVVRGVGLGMLDPRTGELATLVPAQEARYLLDPAWAPDGSVLYLTQVTILESGPRWSVVAVDPDAGTLEVLVPDALAPAPTRDGVHVLRPDVDGNGRAVVRWQDGRLTPVLHADDPMTLDHLMAGGDDTSLVVAAHQQDGGGITFGAPAAAHDGPATWWRIDLATSEAGPVLAGGTVMDAMLASDGRIVWLTRDGLVVSEDGRPLHLLGSRALRFVTSGFVTSG